MFKKKIDAEISGHVIGFSSFQNYKNEQITLIIIKCISADMEKPIEQHFNYSSKWSKYKLKKGDKVKFQAKIKMLEYFVHITERWHDEWNRLPPELIDIEVQIEIQNPKQIVKL